MKEKIFTTLYNLYTEKNANDLLLLEDTKDEKSKKKIKKNNINNNNNNKTNDKTIDRVRNTSNSSRNSKDRDNNLINNNFFNNKTKVTGIRSTLVDLKKDINKLLVESDLQTNESQKQQYQEVISRKFNTNTSSEGKTYISNFYN